MDELVKKIAGFGTPGLILMIVINSTGLVGAAAITASLSALGPFGMVGGIGLLLFIGLSADKIAEFGYEKITQAVVKEQLKKFSKNEIISKVNKYPISKGMKLKIIQFIEKST
ncbi:hypothetical protein [Leuconostoc gasicomitatum]|jgi:hypothetical protein|uniref:hypothetical protein n=1 Tax=Leuconostoc gasicomitatum TaxID=115778 RepID=UPI000744B774|nr:hypothetical protein [Leuconostoc gasicomitatum]MBZ5972422.1 hypothetical protein [Leuconostoc gasicomitatum]CUR64574.1 Uncharacterized protein LEKG_1987 [Leuconostoc gasicomitatum KG16-1]